MTDTLPKKLKNDAILEAVLEVRFEPDASLLPEIVFGRFADAEAWRSFRQARLPTADIPAPIRRADATLRYQPSIEFISPDGGVSIRIGPQVLAYSRRGKYPGWGQFGAELEGAVEHLYRVVPKLHVSRLGLRYINALRSDVHEIRSFSDMDIAIAVAGQSLSSNLNLNFKAEVGTNFESMSRIATIDLAEGSIPDSATVIVDVDVYTARSFAARDVTAVKEWVLDAHQKEKDTFFKILGKTATERLRED